MSDESSIEIRVVQENDLLSLNAALNEVCAERRYIATVNGFTLEAHREFLKRITTAHLPAVVALDAGMVVGWCDMLPSHKEGFTHVGRLGMGVRKAYRALRIGRRLLAECLRISKQHGLEKIELEVFSDNTPAIGLYESFGFRQDGLKPKARKLDGRYQDIVLMGLFLDDYDA